ncbi:MAG: hypothetical protein MK085_00655 [Phycisphaerales bacterium]|nr:hypothetical protein [Phycisphaerales bacterium]
MTSNQPIDAGPRRRANDNAGPSGWRCIHVLRLGPRSLALESVLAAEGFRVRTLQDKDLPAAMVGDDPLLVDGAISPASAAARLRRLGLAGPLAGRMSRQQPLLACGNAAIALGIGRLDRRIRGLGVLGARIVRDGFSVVPGFRGPDQGWFTHGFLFQPNPGTWSSDGQPTALLDGGSVVACGFDPGRSGELGRNLVRQWLVAAGWQREEAA